MKVRTITIAGFDVEIWKFDKQLFYYPSFNGNAEFRANKKGFRELYRYLRTVKRHDILMEKFGKLKISL